MAEQQWSPRDEKNPFRVLSMMAVSEWLEVTGWYPFSVRSLVVLGGKGKWHEIARCKTWNYVREVIQLLGQANENQSHLPAWVVMQCSRVGKEGREKPVFWYPSEGSVRSILKSVEMEGSE